MLLEKEYIIRKLTRDKCNNNIYLSHPNRKKGKIIDFNPQLTVIILNANELNVPIKIFLDWFLNTHIHVSTCAHTQS